MNKNFFMFWDTEKKNITNMHNGMSLSWNDCYKTCRSESHPTEDHKMDYHHDRYTPLRCAIHAPELLDESTGETRQLMEGDVFSGYYYGELRMIVFMNDALVCWCCTNEVPTPTKNDKGLAIKGNALIDPSLVADWKTLPDWPLLQEREAEWKAAQLKDDREIGYIKKDLAAAKAIIKSTEERIAKMEAKT